MSFLETLQRGNALRPPYTVSRPTIRPGCPQMLLDRLNSRWRYGLDISERRDALRHGNRGGKWNENRAGAEDPRPFHDDEHDCVVNNARTGAWFIVPSKNAVPPVPLEVAG